MPASSLVKFMHQKDAAGKPLHWGRADLDGAPYRGAASSLMVPEEELESRLTRVYDPQNQTFDLSDPEDNKAYLAVVDKVSNKWAQLLCRKFMTVKVRRVRDLGDGVKEVTRDVKIKVYVEWLEVYMEDGQPMHSQRPYLGRSNGG